MLKFAIMSDHQQHCSMWELSEWKPITYNIRTFVAKFQQDERQNVFSELDAVFPSSSREFECIDEVPCVLLKPLVVHFRDNSGHRKIFWTVCRQSLQVK